MTRIGKNYILKCIFEDGDIGYWAKSKCYKFVMDPSNATLFKTKKQADNKARKLESDDAFINTVITKEVQLMLIP